MSKHTPGPWVVDSQNRITTALGEPIMWGWDDGSIVGHRSNLLVAAAAPELLEALKAANEWMTNSYETDNDAHIVALIDAAIDKAEGK